MKRKPTADELGEKQAVEPTDDPGACPECGAPQSLCRGRFEEFLTKEFEDFAFGAVHNLTVAAYMLQHSSMLTREGWIYERALLRDFLVGGKRPVDIRRERRAFLDGRRRTFKIRSRDGVPLFPRPRWSMTILDVSPEPPVVYRKQIETWARAVLADSETVQLAEGKA